MLQERVDLALENPGKAGRGHCKPSMCHVSNRAADRRIQKPDRNVMKNPYVNIIGHPDDGRYDIDSISTMRACTGGKQNMVKFWSLIITP